MQIMGCRRIERQNLSLLSLLTFTLLCPAFTQVQLEDDIRAANLIQSALASQSGIQIPNAPPAATAWLRAFHRTGNRRPPPLPKRHPRTNWWRSTQGSIHKPPITCGRDASVHPTRDHVLIVPAGSDWKAEKWLQHPEEATFDVIAIYHGKNAFSCPLCKTVYNMKGPKWKLYRDLTMSPDWDSIARKYEYIMLPDDDLDMDTCTINTVFRLMKEHDILLGQPSVCVGAQGYSGTWRPLLHQRVEFQLRFTTFVEVMSPTFRMDFFDDVIRNTFSNSTYVGWGLDSVWPSLLGYPRDRIAIIDAVCMAHVPTPGGMGVDGKAESVYRPGLSPFSPKEEEEYVFNIFNYNAENTEALGEPYMSIRDLGGIINEEVAVAMTRSLGTTWPRPGSPLAVMSRPSATGTDGTRASTFQPYLDLHLSGALTLAAMSMLTLVALAKQHWSEQRLRNLIAKIKASAMHRRH